MSNSQFSEIDQQALHGRHDRVADERADIATRQLKWRDRWAEKVVHRATNQPLDAEDDEMHVDNRRYGIGVIELVIIGGTVLILAAMIGAFVTAMIWLWHSSEIGREMMSDREVIRETVSAAPHEHADRDTIVIPRLRFGPNP